MILYLVAENEQNISRFLYLLGIDVCLPMLGNDFPLLISNSFFSSFFNHMSPLGQHITFFFFFFQKCLFSEYSHWLARPFTPTHFLVSSFLFFSFFFEWPPPCKSFCAHTYRIYSFERFQSFRCGAHSGAALFKKIFYL